eukprot:SAG31_NODE_3765_length_3903_cov_1.945846_2_plen_183_part_00
MQTDSCKPIYIYIYIYQQRPTTPCALDVCRYAGGPAVTLHRYTGDESRATATADANKYNVWYLSTHLGPADLSRFMLSVSGTVGLRSAIPPQLGNEHSCGGVEATVREYGRHRWLVIINHNEYPAQVQIPASRQTDANGRDFTWHEAVDLLTGCTIASEVEGGTCATIALAPQGVVVLQQCS